MVCAADPSVALVRKSIIDILNSRKIRYSEIFDYTVIIWRWFKIKYGNVQNNAVWKFYMCVDTYAQEKVKSACHFSI